MLAGKGIKAVAVMWVMTALSFILVPLRLYTRVYVLKALGLDDHIFNLGWLFLFLYTLFVTIAGIHGFGQNIQTLDIDEAVRAVYMEMVGQTFAILGMAIAKVSLGVFLLRIVVVPWHRVSIWICITSLSMVSVMTTLLFWIQRLPTTSVYDPRVPGRTILHITPVSILLGTWCAAVDFYFAILPWIFIWKLNMRYKEKMTIAISLSLGFIAGICGVIRTIELGGLASSNYTEDTVNLIVWSGVELAVTLICVGIPTVQPLYRRVWKGSKIGDSGDSGSGSHGKFDIPARLRPKRSDNYSDMGLTETQATVELDDDMNRYFDGSCGTSSPCVTHCKGSHRIVHPPSVPERQSEPGKAIYIREEVTVETK
ncbi:hypothetical protein FE257_010120 [Aspergillus nanangensis]|uniref:Rhodopsin domain-containing protein n=1 Tax=Aspergillus nanangensis TaxID=2582783 RepID=A0AAD4CJQ3_ASPNN|nr:hypothetical protein FE257_010120 [Aspergillus nanangensis]